MQGESLLPDAPIIVVVTQGPTHVLTFVNQSCLQAFGVAEAIVGQPAQQAFTNLHDNHFTQLFDTVRQSGRPHFDYERHLQIADGNKMRDKYFNFALQPVIDAEGAIKGVCMYGMEVTPQVQVRRKYRQNKQRQLQAQTVQLRQQNDELKELNTSKDEFIALASHQLRTPATGVKQYLSMVLDGYVGEVPPAQVEFLRQAYSSNERQLNTINDLLQIAQIDANKITLNTQACDVVQLVEAVVSEQRSNSKRRRQEIVVRKPAGPVMVWADPLRLRMVLDNLVDNASKYSREHTTITIHAIATSGAAELRIADQGVGIAAQDIGRLFQKFSRIDNPLSIVVGGNGLGLYLVKKLVDAHGGRIEVASQLQKGTIFTLILPTPPQV